MSFLQLISKPSSHQSSNPAFQQLDRKVLPRWSSFKSEPKDRTPSDPDESPHLQTKFKPRTATLHHKLFARGKNPTNQDLDPECNSPSPKPGERLPIQSSTARVQYHHSFSNYLSKKPANMRRTNLKGRLKYFDLNEIVNKIASPIKLEHKLDGE
jgi:hypothetical protein